MPELSSRKRFFNRLFLARRAGGCPPGPPTSISSSFPFRAQPRDPAGDPVGGRPGAGLGRHRGAHRGRAPHRRAGGRGRCAAVRASSASAPTPATGAKYVAAACANCKRQLTQLMEFHNEKVAVGGVHDMLSRSILINGKAAVRTDYL